MAFSLKSRAFEDGDEIPWQFTADGDDVSPPLSWSGHPPNTASFALVVKDGDVRDKDKGVHWTLWNIPATTRVLPRAVPNTLVLKNGSYQGRNDFQKIGYSGPRLAQVTEHHYEFTLYALDSKLSLKEGSTAAELTVAMGGHAGHILAEKKLVGRFKPERAAARLRALESDKEYVSQSDDLKQKLELAYNTSPKEVTAFFSKFSLASTFALEKINEQVATIGDNAVRRTLDDYVKFANRFRVEFRLKSSPLSFKTLLQPSLGKKFHVKIVGDHLESGKPASAPKDHPFGESFEAIKLKIFDEAQGLVNKGQATFTQIDDGPGYSILKDFEVFAYKDDGVAFFLHNAEHSYLGCIFGEKISKQLLHDMGKTVTQFQKEHFSRTAGGRPPDIERLKKALEIDKKPISNKAKAAELAGDVDQKKVKTQEVKLSKMKRDKRKKKHQ